MFRPQFLVPPASSIISLYNVLYLLKLKYKLLKIDFYIYFSGTNE